LLVLLKLAEVMKLAGGDVICLSKSKGTDPRKGKRRDAHQISHDPPGRVAARQKTLSNSVCGESTTTPK
jgi:hypothetical protein